MSAPPSLRTSNPSFMSPRDKALASVSHVTLPQSYKLFKSAGRMNFAMAGAGKRRARLQAAASSCGEPSSSEDKTSQSPGVQRNSPEHLSESRSSPQSLPRFDGNADPQRPGATFEISSRNVLDSLGVAAHYSSQGLVVPDFIPRRPGKLNMQGKEVPVKLNSFNVTQVPTKPVYQYDVNIGSGTEKRGLVMNVWESKTVKAKIGNGWLFDGNKIAWSLHKMDSITLEVDLDVERGRNPREDRKGKNKHRFHMRSTKILRFDLLGAYLGGKADYGNEITEAIIFLDHLMRETPSGKFTKIKKSFFARGQARLSLTGAIEAFKGVFSSIRVATSPANKPCLTVTVDVANGTFFQDGRLHEVVMHMLNLSNPQALISAYAKAQDNWDRSMLKTNLKRLSKVRVVVGHRGVDRETKGLPVYTIDKIMSRTPQQHKIEIRDGESRQWMTVSDYFRRKYNITVLAGLPLVKMTKKDIYMPLEVCKIEQNQRYPFKLNEKQTSNMIKFAVTPPKERWASIDHGLGMLNWPSDPALAHFGLKIDPKPVVVKARQLQPPQVTFGGTGNQAHVAPNEAGKGRWMLLGKKFLSKNTVPLKSWGVCVIQGRGSVDAESAKRFFTRFIEVYKKHGGEVVNSKFQLMQGNLQQGTEMVTNVWNATGNMNQFRPQLLFFVVPDRNSETYNRIKKICECRLGVVTQFLQSAHVMKNQDQYHSNVCMKVNAKLGGFTSRAQGALAKIAPSNAKIKTMAIGADVSHPAPGALKDGSTGSFAAITMSLDLSLTRYAAQCDTNGFRVEMISTPNINNLLGRMVTHWMTGVGEGKLPERIIYFRDGVSEPQYQHVLDQEVRDIRSLLRRLSPKSIPQLVVIVASKRHHVRFFPEGRNGDRNGNPNPGTLVETGVTHPFQFDFYLCAHSAIKGTARPVHYTVLMNEAKMSSEEIQQMIFEHSFQYIRSTTPVSLFPAVYYAHLASQRARGHASDGNPSSGKKQTTEPKETATSTSEKTPTEVAPITPMNNNQGIDFSMWYI
ncbi:piwi domain-containing protein [Diplodia corticola]|uniref:Piwi domain-containing protein n=1 Tax=Diplodia corticola TaxID=236234 RepID=A0A1J9S566_9PEZI|nr:piwi domain-containing protein [Diplodia corticola]OJD34765.1 piwi domain-containing protein [Diplodia corticola]